MLIASALPLLAKRTPLLRAAVARTVKGGLRCRSLHTTGRRPLATVSTATPSATSYLQNLPKTFFKQPVAEFKKVLVIGSGGLSIGQAGEFDYSGTTSHIRHISSVATYSWHHTGCLLTIA